MRPELSRFLNVATVHLALKTAPALSGYEQASATVLGLLLQSVREEAERAAARRVEENRALRRLFEAAVPVVGDTGLRGRLEAAARGEDTSLLVADLEASNAELRALMIELHAEVETLDSPEARGLESAIWSELVASTERRRLSLGTF